MMKKTSPPDLEELCQRIEAMHGERVAAHARLVGVFAMAKAMLDAASKRREIAEEKVIAAVQILDGAKATEHEWLCIVHGLLVQVARDIDALGPRGSGASRSDLSWKDAGGSNVDRVPDVQSERYGLGWGSCGSPIGKVERKR